MEKHFECDGKKFLLIEEIEPFLKRFCGIDWNEFLRREKYSLSNLPSFSHLPSWVVLTPGMEKVVA